MTTNVDDAAFQCIFIMDDALNFYIQCHDDIHKKQSALLAFLRCVFGRTTNWSALEIRAKRAESLWAAARHFVKSEGDRHRSDWCAFHEEFFPVALSYATAVHSSAQLLVRRQFALRAKYEGAEITLNEYRDLERDYQQSVEDYLAISVQLQTLTNKLFERNKT